jgi:ribosomal-protein-alanine N-acetyltransferase
VVNESSVRVIQPGEFLNGERLFLRLVTLEDCTEMYVAWLNDSEVNRYLETGWVKQTLDSVRRYIEAMLDSTENYLFAIVLKHNHMHIGNLKIGPVHVIHSYADVGYFIGRKELWRQGYATEAISVALEFAFNRLKLHRLQAGVCGQHSGGIGVLQKLGFVREGTLRKKLKLRTGNGWDDHLLFGILREEWQKRVACITK